MHEFQMPERCRQEDVESMTSTLTLHEVRFEITQFDSMSLSRLYFRKVGYATQKPCSDAVITMSNPFPPLDAVEQRVYGKVHIFKTPLAVRHRGCVLFYRSDILGIRVFTGALTVRK